MNMFTVTPKTKSPEDSIKAVAAQKIATQREIIERSKRNLRTQSSHNIPFSEVKISLRVPNPKRY